HDIYVRTKNHLHGIGAKKYSTSDEKLKGFIESMPERYVISSTSEIVQADYLLAAKVSEEVLSLAVNKRPDSTAEIVVATKDKPGLFSKIVGVLRLKGLNILRARIYTSNKALALDKILLSNWSSIWWEGLEEQLKEDLYNAVVLDTPICPERGFLKPSFAGKRLENFIEIDNETSSSHTLIELQLADRIGLLFDISEQLFRHKIDITSAVINTEDGVARDVFYLQHNGGKLTADLILRILGSMYHFEIEKTETISDSLQISDNGYR
ncbi:MAG TPA: hypothetical protein VEJ88_01955, partial [Dissulfurispiraceae bacterium]|nr:hypothetical protein [Dissulfurispiraceae bacterium]